MFKSKQTSAFPWGWGKQPKRSYKKPTLVVTGIAAGATLLAGVLSKKTEKS